MAGRKGRRKAEVTNISPALVPSAAFAVVPRTPAPQPVPTSGPGGSAEVLNASLLGRQPAGPDTGPGGDDELFSDPESSLYDYQVMEEAGYSSVEMLSMSKKRRSMSDRDPAATPPSQSRQYELSHGGMMPDLDSPELHQNPESLYAKPIKKGQQERPHPTSQSLRSTAAVRDAMRQVQDLSSDDEEPPQTRTMSRSRKRMARQAEKQHSARSLHFPVEHETALKDRTSSAPTTPRAHTPRSRGSARSEERGIQEEEIEPVQMRRQQQAASGLYDVAVEPTLSARSTTMTQSARSQSARSVSMADDKIRSLEAEREHLSTLTQQLESEVQTYREVVSTYESGDSGTAQSLLTKKQVNDLREENESLKNSIRRLNVELSSYQAKYRTAGEENTGDYMGIPSKGPLPSWLNMDQDPLVGHPVIRDLNIRYLNPLFLAYDDRIREREETIKMAQEELESLRQRTIEVVKENEKLHSRLEQGGNGPMDNTEWAQMRENAKLVLEENQNLLEQINVKDEKAQDLHQAHVREVSKLSKQLVLAKAEKTEAEQELSELRQAQVELKHRHDKLVLESQGHVTKEQHIREIAEHKQHLIDKEEEMKQDVDQVTTKLHASQTERKALASQVIELNSQNRRYQAEIKNMHRAVRKAQSKMAHIQQAIEQSETAQEYIASIIKVAEKNAFERDTYEKMAKDNEIETKRAMKKLLHGNITVGKMEEKLKAQKNLVKLYKMKAAARISTVAERLKEQEELFNSQKKEYEREINHLRNIIREKEELYQETSREKRDVECDLETMWQAANSENFRMKGEISKTMTKLRQHKGLSDALDERDKLEAMYLSSDDEIENKAS